MHALIRQGDETERGQNERRTPLLTSDLEKSQNRLLK